MEHKKNVDDEVVISACCTNDSILNQFLGKCNLYGEPKYVDIISHAENAGSSAESLGMDKLIARAISTGLEIASPTYEDIGEKFLKDILKDYTKGNYGADLIKGILKKLSSERLDKISEGVKDILDTGDSNIKEARFAKFINDCYHMTDSLEDRGQAISLSLAAISISLESMKKHDKFILNENSANYTKEMINDPDTKHRKKNEWKFECRDNLDFAFEYFMNNTEEIPESFFEYFPGMDKRKLLAYYVTTRSDTGLLEFVEKIKNKK
jgi:hypothetical protein